MAHYVSHLSGNCGEYWIARGRWGMEKGHHPHSQSDHTAGRRSRERERERERETHVGRIV